MKIPKSRLHFLASTIVPFILVYGVYFSVLQFYIYPHYNLFSARAKIKKEYLDVNNVNDVDYLIIGDSSGMYTINPLILSENSLNMANVAQTTYFTYKQLIANPNLKIKKAILITQTFIPDHYNDDVWSILVPSAQMQLSDIFNTYCHDTMKNCTYWKKIELGAKYLSQKFYLNPQSLLDFTTFIRNFDVKTQEGKLKYFKNFIKDNRGHYASPNFINAKPEEIEESWQKNFKLKISDFPKSEIFYLNLIFKWAQDKKIPIFFFIGPLASSIYPQFNTDEYSKSVMNILKMTEVPSNRIIDSHNFKKLFTEIDFVDINHLNEDGAKKNTLAIKNVLMTSD